MTNLVISLPTKDRRIALEFIHKRKFRDLLDLVNSALIIVKRNEDNHPEANCNDMEILKSIVSEYLEPLEMIDYEEVEGY